VNNARLFSHFACGWHPETLLLARPVSQFTRKVSHLCPENPYQIKLCRVYKRRQTYYKPRARGGARSACCYAPASGGKTGASRLDGPQTPSDCSGLSGSPARRAVGALPPPYGRRFPCASIRARRRARDAIVYRSLWLAEKGLSHASNLGKPHRGASGRRQSPRGAGGRLRDADRRCPRPKWGGERNRPRADASAPRAVACQLIDTSPCTRSHSTRPRPMPISNLPKSCRSLVRNSCRTRGGLAVLGRNTDMRRHGVLRPKTDKPQPLRGRGA